MQRKGTVTKQSQGEEAGGHLGMEKGRDSSDTSSDLEVRE